MFQLYDVVEKQSGDLINTPLLDSEESFVLHQMNKSNQGKLYYMLIWTFAENHSMLNSPPFKYKKLKSGIKYDFSQFPVHLQRLLHTFSKMEVY